MSFLLPARVTHTSTTTGTGTLALIDPASNMQAFSGYAGAGPVKVLYFLSGASYWEVGVGTYTGGGTKTLTRDTILASSSGGSAVSLPTGTHEVAAWFAGSFPSVVLTGTTTLGIADLFQFNIYTGGAGNLNLPAVANVPAGVAFAVINQGSGDLLADGNGSETINGATTLNIKPGQGAWFFYQGPTSGQWRALMGTTGSPAALDVVQTFTAAQTISVSGLTPLTEISTDAGASAGPVKDLYRDSASPAVNDILGELLFSGRSSSAVKRSYADIIAQILDPTNASEDAQILLRTMVAGTLGNRLAITNGVYTPGATGGDKGADTINAGGLYVNGTVLGLTKKFTSTNQTITSAGALTIAHGLGVRPDFVTVELECTSDDITPAYATGHIIEMSLGSDATAAVNHFGVSVLKDATNLTVRFGSNTQVFMYPHRTTGDIAVLTNANWVARFKAYA